MDDIGGVFQYFFEDDGVRGDDGCAGGHGFECHQAEAFVEAGEDEDISEAIKRWFVDFVDEADPAEIVVDVEAAAVSAQVGEKLVVVGRFAPGEDEGKGIAIGFTDVGVGEQESIDLFAPIEAAEVEDEIIGQVVFCADGFVIFSADAGMKAVGGREVGDGDMVFGDFELLFNVDFGCFADGDDVIAAADGGADEGGVEAGEVPGVVDGVEQGDDIEQGGDELDRAGEGRPPIGHVGDIGVDIVGGAGEAALLEEDFAELAGMAAIAGWDGSDTGGQVAGRRDMGWEDERKLQLGRGFPQVGEQVAQVLPAAG